MPIYVEILLSALLIIGGLFGLVGSFGLIKLNDTMRRLHGPTKATTLGVGGILIASMVGAWYLEGKASFHELLIVLFLFLTAPITANFIAKAHLHRNEKEANLPRSGGKYGWALFDAAPPEDRPIDTK